jgi:hypothetical protein
MKSCCVELCRPAAVVLSACVSLLACGPGNTGRTAISEALASEVPWVNGRPPVHDEAGQVVMPSEPAYPQIATGMDDPGSRRADCRGLVGLQFSNVWFLNFEADPAYPDAVGIAAAWAGHDDDSEGSFRTPGEANWYRGLLGRHGAPWGLPAQRVDDAPRCDGKDNDWALHYRGGRFNLFGGGIGHPLALLNPCPEAKGDGHPDDLLCPPAPAEGDTTDGAGLPLAGRNGEPYAQPHSYWNLSGFDGIAFWARRGPEGQGSLTVIITDKHTSDDLNRENETYCRRLVKCRTRCLNRQECTPVDPELEDTVHRCFDPAQGLPLGLEDSLLDELYPRCGPSACTFPSTYPDVDYEGKDCRPFTFDTHFTGEFCFDAGDPPPPDTGARCGDGYARTVTLNGDWTFFKVPFSELRQQGYGKVSPYMDLTTISNVTFVVQQGWADFYLDNVTFYREAR